MADIDDLKLDRTPDAVPPRPPRLPRWLPIGVVVLALAVFAIWYFGSRRGTLRVDTPVSVAETEVGTKPSERLPGEPGENIDLPPLDESDPLIRTLVGRLSSHPQVAAWLTTDHLIRNMAVVVTNIANGQTPARQLRVVRPIGPFAVKNVNGALYLDPAGYRRYDNLAAAVDSLDARGVARFYATIKPRLDEAYRDLGASDEDLDGTVERAIVMLLKTPVVDREIRLRAESVSYTFDDPALEGLTKAQRQFLRMGPRNMRVVKDKLREVAHYLGIPDASLPPADAR